MQVVYQTKRYSAKGWMHKVYLDKDGYFKPFWKHRKSRNYSGTFYCKTLDEALKHFENI